MKNSEFYGLLAAIYISPVGADWANVGIALICIAVSIRAHSRDD